MTRCDACAFDYRDHGPPEIVREVDAAGHDFAARVWGTVDDHVARKRLLARPSVEAWSALEDACHVRDVLLVQRERLLTALVEDTPTVVPMYRDLRPNLAGYVDIDPVRLAVQLEVATELFVDVCARLDDTEWRRRCVYNHPERNEVDLVWVVAHTLHECVHHLDDFDRALAQAGSDS